MPHMPQSSIELSHSALSFVFYCRNPKITCTLLLLLKWEFMCKREREREILQCTSAILIWQPNYNSSSAVLHSKQPHMLICRTILLAFEIHELCSVRQRNRLSCVFGFVIVERFLSNFPPVAYHVCRRDLSFPMCGLDNAELTFSSGNVSYTWFYQCSYNW